MPVPYLQGARHGAWKRPTPRVAPAFESGRSTLRVEVNATIEVE